MESVNSDVTRPVPVHPSIEDTQQIHLPPKKLPHVPPFTELPRDIEQMAAEMRVLTPKQSQANEVMKNTADRIESNSANLKAGITTIQAQEHEKNFEERRRQAVGVREQSRNYFERAKQDTVPVRIQNKEPWYKRGLLKKLWW